MFSDLDVVEQSSIKEYIEQIILNKIIVEVVSRNSDCTTPDTQTNEIKLHLVMDQGNLLKGIDIWSGAMYKGVKSPFDNICVTSNFDQ